MVESPVVPGAVPYAFIPTSSCEPSREIHERKKGPRGSAIARDAREERRGRIPIVIRPRELGAKGKRRETEKEKERERDGSSVERNEGSETTKEERGRGEREREGKRKREIVAGMVVWPHPVEPANGLSADRRPT